MYSGGGGLPAVVAGFGAIPNDPYTGAPLWNDNSYNAAGTYANQPCRIPWPRCRLPGGRGGGSGLLVDEELARAVRCESALAIRHWWGVAEGTVWRWRQALGVGRLNEGSARLRRRLNQEIGAGLRGKRLPPDQVERRRRTALELGLRPRQRPGGRPWTETELALLGTAPDAEVAARVGRTEAAVRVMRTRLGLPTAADRWRRDYSKGKGKPGQPPRR